MATDADQPGPALEALVTAGTLTGDWQLDPATSTVEFHVKHFWGLITVHGWFERLSGKGSVSADHGVEGVITIDGSSLQTKNKQRDKHLRSGDFFDVENNPDVVITVTSASLSDDGQVDMTGTFEAAGIREPITFSANVIDASADAVTIRAELKLDRTRFGMTWSPMRIAASDARGVVTARFTRSADEAGRD